MGAGESRTRREDDIVVVGMGRPVQEEVDPLLQRLLEIRSVRRPAHVCGQGCA